MLSPPCTPPLLLVVVGAPTAITTVICGGVATTVAVVVGGQWLVIKGRGGHTIVCHQVPVKWGGRGLVMKKWGKRGGHTIAAAVTRRYLWC